MGAFGVAHGVAIMAKIDEWSGNEQTYGMISNDTNSKLNDFCNAHKLVYIYGAGKIGTGFKNYLEQCDVPLKGFITSDTLNEFMKLYRQGEIGVIIGMSDANLKEVMPLLSTLVSEDDLFVADTQYRETIGQFCIESVRDNLVLTIVLASHCNLNCKSCSAFSPVAHPDFYKYEDLEKDIKQIKSLGLKINSIRFTGGEPYLHPELFSIFKLLRMSFPSTELICVTNGMLLDKLSDAEIHELVGMDIINKITVYPPLRKQVNSFCLKAESNNAKYIRINLDETKNFTLRRFSLSKSAPKYDFYNCFCYKAFSSIFLYKGKLYGCLRTALISSLNYMSDVKLTLVADDFIDIYKTTKTDIFKFKITRRPFCGYHNSANASIIEWDLSERKIEEWVNINETDEGSLNE